MRADEKQPPVQKSKYYAALADSRRAEADKIESMRQIVLADIKKTQPYDVFICYKQHEDNSDRETVESKWARSLYHRLDKEGFAVFYDEESLKGSNVGWEPQIYAALVSARFMIVLGSSIEHINSRWVKNEWKRFLLHKQFGDEKTIAVLGLNIDPYMLPDKAMRDSQMVSATDGDWENVLLKRAHDACFKSPQLNRKTYEETTYKKKAAIKTQIEKRTLNSYGRVEVSASERTKLSLADEFLKKRNFNNAGKLLAEILASNPSNSEAHFKSFLVQNRCVDENTFVSAYPNKVPSFDSLEAAIASGDDGQKKKCYDMLYNRALKGMEIDVYEELIALPDTSEQWIKDLTDRYFDIICSELKAGKATVKAAVFCYDSIIKTVTDTDKYISMNLKFANLLMPVSESTAATYYAKVLEVDEGNKEVLYRRFLTQNGLSAPENLAKYCFVKENHTRIEEALYSYGFNDYATSEFYDLCMKFINMAGCADFLEFILTLIPADKNRLFIKYSNGFTDELIKNRKFDVVTKFNEQLIAADSLNYAAYFNRVLVTKKVSNPLGLMDCAETLFDDPDYFKAMTAYTEKFPNDDNLYVNIAETLKKCASMLSDRKCRSFVLAHLYVPQDKLAYCERDVSTAMDSYENLRASKTTGVDLDVYTSANKLKLEAVKASLAEKERRNRRNFTVKSWFMALPVILLAAFTVLVFFRPVKVFRYMHWGWMLAIYIIIAIVFLPVTSSFYANKKMTVKRKKARKTFTSLGYILCLGGLAACLALFPNRSFEINDMGDMKAVGNMTGGQWTLMTDLDYEDVKFKPMTGPASKKTVLDGNGHAIRNIDYKTDKKKSYFGFFKKYNGTITNLRFYNCHYELTNSSKVIYCGMIAGAGSKDCTVEKCFVADCSITIVDAPNRTWHNATFGLRPLVGSCDDVTFKNNTYINCKITIDEGHIWDSTKSDD